MSIYSEIPTTNRAQEFTIQLSGVQYWLTLVYNSQPESGWILNIADAQKAPIINGIPLVTGIDLLEQYAHLQFGGRLWVQTFSNPDAVPTYENLGTDGKLLWVVDE